MLETLAGRECGLVKSEIRRLSKEGGLFTWDKPSYACLATRIPTGSDITAEKLQKTEAAELLNELKKSYPAVLLDLEVRG